MTQPERRRHEGIRTLLIVLVGQVGCVTLAVVILSVVLGVWLDATFSTKPVITLVLLFAGVPVSVILMLLVARRTLTRLQEHEELHQEKSP
jgi:hypothetical protein